MLIIQAYCLNILLCKIKRSSWASPGRPPAQRQEGTGSVRFVSVPDFLTNNRFGSVWFGNSFFRFYAVRPAFFGRVVARSGSVRFGSAGAIRFLAPSCHFLSGSLYFCGISLPGNMILTRGRSKEWRISAEKRAVLTKNITNKNTQTFVQQTTKLTKKTAT